MLRTILVFQSDSHSNNTKITLNLFVQDYDFVLNDNGFPKNSYPNHWKGKNGLYCAGLARMGLQGASKDAIAIANDIELALQNMVALEEL